MRIQNRALVVLILISAVSIADSARRKSIEGKDEKRALGNELIHNVDKTVPKQGEQTVQGTSRAIVVPDDSKAEAAKKALIQSYNSKALTFIGASDTQITEMNQNASAKATCYERNVQTNEVKSYPVILFMYKHSDEKQGLKKGPGPNEAAITYMPYNTEKERDDAWKNRSDIRPKAIENIDMAYLDLNTPVPKVKDGLFYQANYGINKTTGVGMYTNIQVKTYERNNVAGDLEKEHVLKITKGLSGGEHFNPKEKYQSKVTSETYCE